MRWLLLAAWPVLAGESPELLVVSRVPAGRTDSRTAASAITATFNQPMVPLASAADMGADCPLRLSPPIKGRCRWQGTNTVAFEPAEPLTPATAYKAVIPAGTKSRVSGAALDTEVSWEFETLRPVLTDSRPRHDERWIGLGATLFLHFNMDMDPRRARDFISLEETRLDGGGGEGVALGVRRATAEEVKAAWPYAWGAVLPSTSNVLALKPGRELRPDRSYRLTLKQDLPAEAGTLGLIARRDIVFETWYSFRALEFPQTECLPRSFPLSFSNPVRFADLLAHLTVSPSTPMPVVEGHRAEYSGGQNHRDRLVRHHLPDLGWAPDTDYSFRVDPGLKDVFGNRLGSELRFQLRTGPYCPRLTTPQGFGVLEGYLPARHPVNAVNTGEVPLVKTRIPEDKFIPFFNGLKWNCDSPETPEGAAVKAWNLGEKRNVSLRTFINLDEVLGDGGGLAFAAVRTPEPGGCWVKAVDNVTRLGLHFKTSPDSGLLWATYLKTGGPAPSVPVEVRDDDNRVLWTGLTDKRGFADIPGWHKLGITDWPRWKRPKLWAFAKDPKGTAVVTMHGKDELAPWRFNVNYDWAPRPHLYQGSLFTERGVYRPGETVYAKGILRKLLSGDWAHLGEKDPRTMVLTVTDSRGAQVRISTAALSAVSSFDFAHALAEEAPTGEWTLSVTEALPATSTPTIHVSDLNAEEDGEPYNPGPEKKINLAAGFRVEAFKPASFEVRVAPERDSYLAGDEYRASVEGWYLFGAPMTEAKMDWKLRLEPWSFSPPGFEGFNFSAGWWERTSETGRLAGSGSASLDGQGRAPVSAKLDPGNLRGPMAAVLEAGVASPDRQRLFGRALTVVHRADLYLGVRSSSRFLEKGQAYRAEVVALRPLGKAAENAAVSGKVVRRDWLSVQRAGVAGRLEWVSEQRDLEVSSFSFTSSRDTFTWTWNPDRPGQYFLSVTAKDEQGRPAEAADSFYVTGTGDAWWSRSDTDIIEIVPDKTSYKPGETARLMVKSPFPKSRALVTVEREGIISRREEWIDGGASFVQIPLNDRSVPNVFVSVVLLQGRTGDNYSPDGEDLAKPQAKFGYATLAVDPGGRRLKVKIKPQRNQFRPRQKVDVEIEITDSNGNGTTGEATAYAVDEGVLALTGYATPDAFVDFYGARPLQVASADSRPYVIGQRSFGEKGKSRGGGGASGANLEGVDLRSRFIPTAFWAPSVQTDAQGRAKVSFTLPDNLSRFRLMAVAHAGKQFGSGEARLTASKPLLLRPSLPRFARVGDSFQCGAVVHNYSSSTARVRLELTLAGGAVSVSGDARRELEVAAGKAAEVPWDCQAASTGTAVFKFRAAAGTETDGLEWKVPVRAPERLEWSATSGATEGTAEEAVARPQNGVPGSGRLKISLAPTALTGLSEGARYLLEYPYGCLEQRLSRMMLVIVGEELAKVFGLGSVGPLKAEVQSNLDKLGTFQHPSGGFGYWPNPDLPDPYVTAYALEVAHLAKKEGYRLPEPVIDRAVGWLSAAINRQDDWAYPYNNHEFFAAQAYAVYALALHGRKLTGYFQNLYERRDQLPFLAKAHLLKAAPLLSRDLRPGRLLADELLNQARQSPRSLHFEEPEGMAMPWIHGTNVKTTAVLLQALLEARGGFPNDEKAVKWLTDERKDKGRWRTTQENAAGLRALTDYFRRYEKDEPRFSAEVTNGTTAAWKEEFSGRSLTARKKDYSLETISGTDQKAMIRFRKTGIGRLYYALQMSFSPSSYKEPAKEGLEIKRTFQPLYSGDKLKAGSRAVVTLTVTTPQDRTFVAVDDPLPAGWEIVDPSFAVEGREDARVLRAEAARAPYWGTFHRNEKYDDRIAIFADYLTAGEHRYSYLIQATTPGRYHAPAAWAEQMYEPEVFGRTASSEIEIVR